MFKERILSNQFQDTKTPDSFSAEWTFKGSATTKPTTPFPQMIDQVADGLIGALASNNNDITKVYSSDILAFTTMEPATFDYYYGSPFTALADIKKEVKSHLESIERIIEKGISRASTDNTNNNNDISSNANTNDKTDAATYAPLPLSFTRALEFLLEALAFKPKHIKVLAMTHELDIWITSLRWIPKYYATNWHHLPPDRQEYLYNSFCFQFCEIITKWANDDFAPGSILPYAYYLKNLLSISTINSDTAEVLFQTAK